MFDPFAAAFADDGTGDFSMVDHSKIMALSPDSKMQLVEADTDDDDIERIVQEAMQDPAPCSIPPKANSIASASKKRALENTGGPPKLPSRRKRGPMGKLKYTQVQEENVKPEIIFVPSKKGEKDPVPLWPQYSATWCGYHFQNTTWLLVCAKSKWLFKIVHASSKNCGRDLCLYLASILKTEVNAALDKARRLQKNNDKILDSGSSDSDTDEGELCSKKRPLTHNIIIGGYDLTCMNSKQTTLLAIDKNVKEFVQNWFLPLTKQVALKPVQVDQKKRSTEISD